MSDLVHDRTVDGAALERLLRPRDDVVAEAAAGEGSFTAREGPVTRYERRVEVLGPDGDGVRVRETFRFRLAVPYWRPLLTIAFRQALRHPPAAGRQPWWAPPGRLDARAATVLSALCLLSVVVGFLGTLLTQTLTFAAQEFGADGRAQGTVLAAVRVGVVVSLAAMAVADRRGRRPVLIATVGASCLLAATGALAPSLFWLGTSQTLARGCSIAAGLLLTIVAAEEVPAGSRAYAVSLLAMTAGLGAGVAVWLLPLADLGVGAWRVIYLVPLLAVVALPGVARRLPESRRFVRPHPTAPTRGTAGRLWLLAASAFLVQLFLAPASQFQNEFLREERGFSATMITVFTLATSTPAGLGIIVGGRLADVRGRRIVGAVGLVGGAVATAAHYLSDGWGLWAWSVTGTVVAAVTVPALGVYGPELFPTGRRGRSNGLISVLSVAGSSAGLLLVGVLSGPLGSIGVAVAVLAPAPVLVAALVLLAYPETAHVELEDLNPEDRPPPAG